MFASRLAARFAGLTLPPRLYWSRCRPSRRTPPARSPQPSPTTSAGARPQINGGGKIDAIRPAPMAGLYEVQIGTDVLYVNETANFLCSGLAGDLEKGRDLTRERKEALVAEMEAPVMPALWSGESLNDAVKLVKGKGTARSSCLKTRIAAIAKAAPELRRDGRHHRLHLHGGAVEPGFRPKARDLWCSADRIKAYDDWMLRSKAPAAADKACADPTQRVAGLIAKRLGVGPVPHVVFADGSKNVGYMPSADLGKKLGTVKATF